MGVLFFMSMFQLEKPFSSRHFPARPRERLKEIENEALELIKKAQNMEVIQELKVKFLGKKGELKSILKSMGSLIPEEKKEMGQEVNRVREKIENLIAESMEKVKKAKQKEKFLKEKVDIRQVL